MVADYLAYHCLLNCRGGEITDYVSCCLQCSHVANVWRASTISWRPTNGIFVDATMDVAEIGHNLTPIETSYKNHLRNSFNITICPYILRLIL